MFVTNLIRVGTHTPILRPPVHLPSILGIQIQRNALVSRSRFTCYAESGGNLPPQSKEAKTPNGEGRPAFFNLSLGELLLNRDPDNILAVGLAGVLTWASVQILWQILVISVAILAACLKYAFVAFILLFIIITLL